MRFLCEGCQVIGGAAVTSSLLSNGSALARSLGEASTSYGSHADVVQIQARWFAKKAAKKTTAAATATAPSTQPKPAGGPPDPRAVVARLRNPHVDPMSLLTEEQLKLVKEISKRPPLEGETAAGSAMESAPPPGLKALGLPLNEKDVVGLVHQSLSNMAGHNVHFRPFFFNNIFQSAPVVASYVAAALEAESSWQRIERFFISSIEGDKMVKGIKVRISGRLGRKASMATIKEWEYGDHSLGTVNTHVDYGAAAALTRMGVTGVKVWLRYHEHAIPRNAFTRQTGFAMPLSEILAQPRSQSAAEAAGILNGSGSSSAAWWSRPGPSQPLQNRSWEALLFDGAPEPTASQFLPKFRANKPPRFSTQRQRDAYVNARRGRAPVAQGQSGRGLGVLEGRLGDQRHILEKAEAAGIGASAAMGSVGEGGSQQGRPGSSGEGQGGASPGGSSGSSSSSSSDVGEGSSSSSSSSDDEASSSSSSSSDEEVEEEEEEAGMPWSRGEEDDGHDDDWQSDGDEPEDKERDK